MPYEPSEVIKKKVDTTLTFVNNIGKTVKSIDDIKKNENHVSHGEVLLNVVKYLSSIAQKEEVKVEPLWLEKIPALIYVNDLIKKYNYSKENGEINPVIGEYDNPSNQSQHLLTMPLTTEGNAAIYGMAGSGKEDLLATLIYSSIITYTPNEVNIYAIDCGSETLKMFNSAPQVGEILTSNDEEKVFNLFKMINDVLNKRKKLFVNFGGSLSFYNNHNEEKLPTILVIINNYDNFVENYGKLEDELLSISRDCVKYGVIFVLTAASSSSGRMKMKQNFSQNFTLQLIDTYDYTAILGNVNKMVPSNIKGRGLIRLEDAYEFQTASICEDANKLDYIGNLCKELSSISSSRAPKVPVLPEFVSIENIENDITNLYSVPIGIEKESLIVSKYDFVSNYMSIISSNVLNNTNLFVNGLIQVIKKMENTAIMAFDPLKTINVDNSDNIVANNDLSKNVELLTDYVKQLTNHYTENNYDTSSLSSYKNLCIFIIGIDEVLNRMDSEIKKELFASINQARVLGIITFIIVDSVNSLKKYQYEEWYKNNVKASNGIWVGNGASDQGIIRIAKITKDMCEVVGNDFGYKLEDGQSVFVKLLKYTKEEVIQEVETIE